MEMCLKILILYRPKYVYNSNHNINEPYSFVEHPGSYLHNLKFQTSCLPTTCH